MLAKFVPVIIMVGHFHTLEVYFPLAIRLGMPQLLAVV